MPAGAISPSSNAFFPEVIGLIAWMLAEFVGIGRRDGLARARRGRRRTAIDGKRGGAPASRSLRDAGAGSIRIRDRYGFNSAVLTNRSSNETNPEPSA